MTTASSRLSDEQLLDSARTVLDTEKDAIDALKVRLDDRFAQACRALQAASGRVVVLGMGKSGHIASKIASTLASTGTPAFFVHPGEAGHGDLGMITRDDVVLALSNSGETPELLTILPMLKRLEVAMVAITGKPGSTLGQQADVCLDAHVEREACPLDLAPTSSTTVALALGDALAVALLKDRGFNENDFARSHPGGALGKRLLLFVSDVMHRDDEIPLVSNTDSLQSALIEMSGKSLGMTGVVDEDGKLVGIFTDGDLRRALHGNVDVYNSTIGDMMTRNPVTARGDMLAAEVVNVMRDRRINGVFVVDDNQRVTGAINNQTLLRAGVM